VRVHIDVLGRLHVIWGIFGVLTGLSLAILAVGTDMTFVSLGNMGRAAQGAIGLLTVCASVLGGGGVVMVVVGWALGRLRAGARAAALVLAVPNLVIVPLGTALGAYTFWVLLNDEARRLFGRPPRSGITSRVTSLEGA
jgi:hypothetical protein